MLTPDQDRIETIGDQLRAKISSKFTAATFLAGFALTLLGGQVFMLWQAAELPRFFSPAAGVLSAALVLFVSSVIRLDELTMPKRFWRSDPGVVASTPPQYAFLTIDDLWALQHRMVFYWQRLTLTATGITTLSLALLLLPVPSCDAHSVQKEVFWWVTGCVFLALLYGVWIRRRAERRYQPLMRPVD
jgi:hypothetical protein